MFTIRTATTAPAEEATTERSSDLPFKKTFSAMQEAILAEAGKQTADIFVPLSFWLSRKGVNKENAAKPGYAKGKLRDQFRSWQGLGKDEKPVEAHAGYKLILIARTGTEADQKEVTLGQPGMQVWLVAPAPTPAKEEQAPEAKGTKKAA